ncbi:MAG: hypothetical protein JSR77_07590 [Planctomycetes bacterium]|nr:hypothetical protein [Planctomycetota bacterium]
MHEDPHIPPELARNLQGLYPETEPSQIAEARLFAAARSALARRRRRRVLWRLSPLAAAAAVGLAVLILPHRATPSTALNLSTGHRIDIRDAFILARAIESNAPPANGDLNHDGRVDGRDVDLLAAAAVRLSNPGAL